LATLQQKKQILDKDSEKFVQLISSLENHKQQQEKKLQQARQILSSAGLVIIFNFSSRLVSSHSSTNFGKCFCFQFSVISILDFTLIHFVVYKETELDALLKEKAALEKKLQQQEMNHVDVERIKQEITQLEESLRAVQKQQEELKRDIWAKEIAVTKAFEEVPFNTHTHTHTFICFFLLVLSVIKRLNEKNLC
jgi:Na+/melibiose symporter-like transporter